MKALKCEMCGSNDVVKQEDLFVCQNCGTKYSVEVARKMMIEGTVEVKGTVTIDSSDELRNLYELARRAVLNDNSENASKYYNQILLKDPNSWEAYFYSVYYTAKACAFDQINIAADSVKNCLFSLLKLIQESILEDGERLNAIKEITEKVIEIARYFLSVTKKHYAVELEMPNMLKLVEREIFVQNYTSIVVSVTGVLKELGDKLDVLYKGEYGVQSVACWKECIVLLNEIRPLLYNKTTNSEEIDFYKNQIRKYDSSYKLPELNKNKGACYVATAVYGSYNCPQVWTLRRFRDNTLDATWYGRAFIKAYYAISPTLVRWFGVTSWFKDFWRKPLDKLVASLRNKGVEDTPYIDKY